MIDYQNFIAFVRKFTFEDVKYLNRKTKGNTNFPLQTIARIIYYR